MSVEILENYLDAELVDTTLEASFVSSTLDAELTRSQLFVTTTVLEVPNSPLTVTGDRPLALSDAHRLLVPDYTSDSVIQLDILRDSDLELPLGTVFEIVNPSTVNTSYVVFRTPFASNLYFGDNNIQQLSLGTNGYMRVIKRGPDEWHVTHYECSGVGVLEKNSTYWSNSSSDIDFEWARNMNQTSLRIIGGQFDSYIAGPRHSADAVANVALPFGGGRHHFLYASAITDAPALLEVFGLTFSFFKDVGNTDLFNGFNNGDNIGWEDGLNLHFKL